MTKLIKLVIVYGSCPNGGDHTPGTGGWAGHCTKCGMPC